MPAPSERGVNPARGSVGNMVDVMLTPAPASSSGALFAQFAPLMLLAQRLLNREMLRHALGAHQFVHAHSDP
jgi:hypothetical protein